MSLTSLPHLPFIIPFISHQFCHSNIPLSPVICLEYVYPFFFNPQGDSDRIFSTYENRPTSVSFSFFEESNCRTFHINSWTTNVCGHLARFWLWRCICFLHTWCSDSCVSSFLYNSAKIHIYIKYIIKLFKGHIVTNSTISKQITKAFSRRFRSAIVNVMNS